MSAQELDLIRGALSGRRLVEASAGTGKTYAVCLLYLRLLLERELTVDQILVVSFTNAATAELRERIRARLAGALYRLRHRDEPEKDVALRELLQRYDAESRDTDTMITALTLAIAEFDRSAIYTIHGFCKRVLDDEPFVTGLPLALELVTDDAEIRERVVTDLYRQWLTEYPLNSALAATLWDKKTLKKLGRELKRRLAKPLAQVRWDPAAPPVGELTAEEQTLFLEARALWLSERALIVRTLKAGSERLNKGQFKEPMIDAGAAQWDGIFVAPSLDRVSLDKSDRLNRFRASKQKPSGKQAPIEPHRFFDLAGPIIDALERQKMGAEGSWHSLLQRVVTDGPQQVQEAKRTQRVMSFDDLLDQLHSKLTAADASAQALAVSLRTRYPVALVDEFQDTDPQQYGIFKSIYADGGSLFLVGDPKQAIYSFRNADLNVYFAASREAHAVETLQHNQRSSREYLTALNALFGHQPAAFALPDLHYLELGLGLKPRPPFMDVSPQRAALQCWSLSTAASGSPPTLHQAREWAATATAAEIARLLNDAASGQVTYDSRPLKAGDIAVIVPTLARGREVRGALTRLGIGSVEISRDNVFDSDEAEDLEQVLTAVLEPSRAGLVRAALATTLLGRNATEIAQLCTDEQLLVTEVEHFAHYRDLWQKRGIGVMLRAVMLDHGVETRLLAGPLGERRMTNLRHLSELLHTAAMEHSTPEALLRWLKMARVEDGHGETAQLRLESDRNLVQIVTIHASKGLEYPIVFCPTLWDDFLAKDVDPGAAIEYHSADDGPVLDYRTGDDTKKAARACRTAEKTAERLRLLYVALTRAVHRCYLVVGAYQSSSKVTAAGRTALQWLVSTAASFEEHRSAVRDAAGIDDDWQSFAGRWPDIVSIAPLSRCAGEPVQPDRPSAAAVRALPPPRPLRESWRVSSYSGLVSGTSHESADRDRDARADENELGADEPELEDDDILRFPRGAQAGHCVHAVFEHADFTTSDEWATVIEQALRRHPPSPGTSSRPKEAAQLRRLLGDVTQTELRPGFTLGSVPFSRRLVEWEFSLPSRHLDPSALGRLLQRYEYPMPPLQFAALSGYLRGFVDLIVEHDGRYYVIDWKSNFLGNRAADYAPEPVRQAMAKNGYHLQHLLYTVALHRYLATRVPDYDYDRHMGGTVYLFVRGVRPAWSDAGIYAERVPRALIEALALLLDQGVVS